MFIKKLILINLLLIIIGNYAFDDFISPLCKNICLCPLNNNSDKNYDIICKKIDKNLIFNQSNWYNEKTNTSYYNRNITIENSLLLSLDQEFPKSDIKILILTYNSIINISDNIFKNLQNLEYLDLGFNRIQVIHPNAFQGLYMEGAFMPLKSMKILKINNNFIHSLDGDIFEHTDRIEELYLNHNPIKIIDQQTAIAITSLVYLKKLDLSYTQLTDLPLNFMHTPKFLQFLDLSGNLFEMIPKTLSDAHSLEILYFNNNPIVNLTEKNGFPKIITLKILHLCMMDRLRVVGKHSLSNLDNLEELYLMNNIDLEYIDKYALMDKRNGAEYNTWPPIVKLYLNNNKLTSIDMLLIGNWNHLNDLDLSDNPWSCDCDNQWMLDELLPTFIKINETKSKILQCGAPIEMKEYSLFDLYVKKTNMRCLDYYGHQPERDATLLVGILTGLLISIPLILVILYVYQKRCFGFIDYSSPASYTRQFYRRTYSNEDYF